MKTIFKNIIAPIVWAITLLIMVGRIEEETEVGAMFFYFVISFFLIAIPVATNYNNWFNEFHNTEEDDE